MGLGATGALPVFTASNTAALGIPGADGVNVLVLLLLNSPMA
jgi:hypothetical protein